MSRTTALTTATITCTPCGIISKVVMAPDAEPPRCACGAAYEVSIAGVRRSNIFPYTTVHLSGDGRPTVVESLHHLRSLERTVGFVAPAFSQNASNLDYPMTEAPMRRRDYHR